MGKSGHSNSRTSSTSLSSPSYTSQALALHGRMGGPHPSATQTVQPINVTGEIADMPYRDNPPARTTRGSGSRRRPLPESSHSSSSSSGSGSGSSGAATPLQHSPPTSSGHAQAQGLHMGMAWAQPHRTQPKPRHRMDPVRQPEAEGIPDFRRGPREWALCGLCEP